MNIASYQFLGIRVSALTIPDMIAVIDEGIKEDKHLLIGNHNLHSIYIYHRDEKMRAFYAEADHVNIDGMPVIFMGRVLGFPLSRDNRFGYMDLMDPLMSQAAKSGWRIFYVGSRPGVANQAADNLRKRFPQLQLTTANGFFNTTPGHPENEKLLESIKSYRPHILMIGMGMPRQEHWAIDNFDALKPATNMILNAGAAFDYVAGVVPMAPRWLSRCGFEWLFRLVIEPKRLAGRYLIEPWFVLRLFLSTMWCRDSKPK